MLQKEQILLFKKKTVLFFWNKIPSSIQRQELYPEMQKGVPILLCTFFLFQQDLAFNTALDKVAGKSCLITDKMSKYISAKQRDLQWNVF